MPTTETQRTSTRRPREKVAELWRLPIAPAISVLVRKGVSRTEARQTVVDYRAWHVEDNDQALLVEGIDLPVRGQNSFWDALILAAARRARAGVIWSEDFNITQDYDGIVAVNPLI